MWSIKQGEYMQLFCMSSVPMIKTDSGREKQSS